MEESKRDEKEPCRNKKEKSVREKERVKERKKEREREAFSSGDWQRAGKNMVIGLLQVPRQHPSQWDDNRAVQPDQADFAVPTPSELCMLARCRVDRIGAAAHAPHLHRSHARTSTDYTCTQES